MNAAEQPSSEVVIEVVEISTINRDLVVRAKGTNKTTVSDYARAMESGAEFPPVVCFRDGRGLHLSDGAHRIEAVLRNGGTTIAAEIRTGNRKDCLMLAGIRNRGYSVKFTGENRA